jgi:hypothetical protein
VVYPATAVTTYRYRPLLGRSVAVTRYYAPVYYGP